MFMPEVRAGLWDAAGLFVFACGRSALFAFVLEPEIFAFQSESIAKLEGPEPRTNSSRLNIDFIAPFFFRYDQPSRNKGFASGLRWKLA